MRPVFVGRDPTSVMTSFCDTLLSVQISVSLDLLLFPKHMWFLYHRTKIRLKENVESYYEKFFQCQSSKALSSLQFVQTGYRSILEIAYQVIRIVVQGYTHKHIT